MDTTLSLKLKATDELRNEREKTRRKAAVDYARNSVRLEGFVPSSFAEDLNRRFIEGELTSKEVTAALLAHYKP